jgi:hypothetical protein
MTRGQATSAGRGGQFFPWGALAGDHPGSSRQPAAMGAVPDEAAGAATARGGLPPTNVELAADGRDVAVPQAFRANLQPPA